MTHNSESLPVTLNGNGYAVDTTQYRRTTVPVSRQQRDNSREPGENTLDTTGAWVRSQTDWSYGAGQLYLDYEDSDRRRFHSSKGINVWTKGQITLLPDTEDAASSLTLGTEDLIVQRFVKAADGTEYLYLVTDSTIFYSSDAGANWSAGISTTANVKSITSDGASLYIARETTNVPQTVALGSASSPTTFGTLTPDLMKLAAGRLIAADGNNIFEMDSAGAKAASSLDFSLPFSSSEWVSVDAGTSGIFAAANTDNTGSVYHIGVNATDGTLQTPSLAGALPKGERINEILAYAGLLAIATSRGFRLALVNPEAAAITIGPVIEKGGEAFALECDQEFMWWGCKTGEVYRANLTRFTETLVPAYAADLNYKDASSGSVDADDTVVSLARINNSANPKLFLGVNKASGASVLYRESLTGVKVTTGWLSVGEITWSTVVPKLLRSGIIDLDRSQFERSKLDYRASGGIDYNYANGTYVSGEETTTPVGKIRLVATNQAGTASTIPSSTGTLLTSVPVSFAFSDNLNTAISYDLRIELEASSTTNTASPICHDWQLTAVAVPRRIDEIILPIVLKRNVLRGRNSAAPKRFAAGDTFSALRKIMEDGTAVTYNEGDRDESVTIERLEMQPERLSDDGSWWEGTLIARLLTVPS